jgi:hypothetical protein
MSPTASERHVLPTNDILKQDFGLQPDFFGSGIFHPAKDPPNNKINCPMFCVTDMLEPGGKNRCYLKVEV